MHHTPTALGERITRAFALIALLAACGCASRSSDLPSPAELDAMTTAMMQSSFRAQGIATLERLAQDPTQKACSSGAPLDAATAERLMEEAKASVKPPSDGRYFGDWKEGEKLAQNGRGMTWTDASANTSSNGGNCYNCHQISKQEVSFGTLGPSLLGYGKARKITSLDSPAAQAAAEFVWMKIYNSKSDTPCSNMPRFGAHGLLSEQQIKHLVALLLDPASSVNQ